MPEHRHIIEANNAIYVIQSNQPIQQDLIRFLHLIRAPLLNINSFINIRITGTPKEPDVHMTDVSHTHIATRKWYEQISTHGNIRTRNLQNSIKLSNTQRLAVRRTKTKTPQVSGAGSLHTNNTCAKRYRHKNNRGSLSSSRNTEVIWLRKNLSHFSSYHHCLEITRTSVQQQH